MLQSIYKLTNVSTGEVIADKVVIANSFISRSVGLLNRNSLNPGEALVIDPCNSIHTFFMKFSIDVIFLDKKNCVRKLARAIRPWRLAGCFSGVKVVELAAGALDIVALKIGDMIRVE